MWRVLKRYGVFADRLMVLPQANVGCRGRGGLGFVVSGSGAAVLASLKNGIGSVRKGLNGFRRDGRNGSGKPVGLSYRPWRRTGWKGCRSVEVATQSGLFGVWNSQLAVFSLSGLSELADAQCGALKSRGVNSHPGASDKRREHADKAWGLGSSRELPSKSSSLSANPDGSQRSSVHPASLEPYTPKISSSPTPLDQSKYKQKILSALTSVLSPPSPTPIRL